MSYHIVSIDAPDCSLSCKDGQLTCKSAEGDRSIPLEDVAAIIITSFSVSIHSKLLLEAAKFGVGLVICEHFKPASLVLPANRSAIPCSPGHRPTSPPNSGSASGTRPLMPSARTSSVWLPSWPGGSPLGAFGLLSRSRARTKEAECAKLFWRIYADHVAETDDFRRQARGRRT